MTKTFASGEILTASDVNNELNPSTCPYIPYAVAAGTAAVRGDRKGTTLFRVNYTNSRFTQTPIVTVTCRDGAGTTPWEPARLNRSDTSGFELFLRVGTDPNVMSYWNWIAVQMEP